MPRVVDLVPVHQADPWRMSPRTLGAVALEPSVGTTSGWLDALHERYRDERGKVWTVQVVSAPTDTLVFTYQATSADYPGTMLVEPVTEGGAPGIAAKIDAFVSRFQRNRILIGVGAGVVVIGAVVAIVLVSRGRRRARSNPRRRSRR